MTMNTAITPRWALKLERLARWSVGLLYLLLGTVLALIVWEVAG